MLSSALCPLPSAILPLPSSLIPFFSKKPSSQCEADGVGDPPAIVARDVAQPEVAFDQLARLRQRAQLERSLMLGGVALEHLGRRPRRVVHDHVNRPADRVAGLARSLARRKAVHPAAFRQQVRDEHDRARDIAERLTDAFHGKNRHQAGVKAAGADDDGVEFPDRHVHRRMNAHRRLEPDPLHELPPALTEIDFHFAPRLYARAVFRAHAGRLDADGPHVPDAAEQRAQSVNRQQKITAVALHHRQQQVATGVPGQARIDRRHARQQHASRLGLVAGERKGAFQHVAGRQHAKFVAQLPGAAAAVEHGDDRVEAEPGILLQPAERAGKPRPTPEAPDVQLPHPHWIG